MYAEVCLWRSLRYYEPLTFSRRRFYTTYINAFSALVRYMRSLGTTTRTIREYKPSQAQTSPHILVEPRMRLMPLDRHLRINSSGELPSYLCYRFVFEACEGTMTI